MTKWHAIKAPYPLTSWTGSHRGGGLTDPSRTRQHNDVHHVRSRHQMWTMPSAHRKINDDDAALVYPETNHNKTKCPCAAQSCECTQRSNATQTCKQNAIRKQDAEDSMNTHSHEGDDAIKYNTTTKSIQTKPSVGPSRRDMQCGPHL